MFNIEEVPTFTETVTVTSPDGQVQDFQAAFEALISEEADSFDLSTELGTRNFVARALHSVSHIVGNDGREVPDGPELRRRLVGMSWCLAPMLKAYFRGIGAAISGN